MTALEPHRTDWATAVSGKGRESLATVTQALLRDGGSQSNHPKQGVRAWPRARRRSDALSAAKLECGKRGWYAFFLRVSFRRGREPDGLRLNLPFPLVGRVVVYPHLLRPWPWRISEGRFPNPPTPAVGVGSEAWVVLLVSAQALAQAAQAVVRLLSADRRERYREPLSTVRVVIHRPWARCLCTGKAVTVCHNF